MNLEYDHTLPLNLTLETGSERDDVVISSCEFDNAEGPRLTGYLVAPKGGTAQAGIVYMHTTSGAEGFLPEAILAARAGAVAICLKMYATPDPVPNLRQSILGISRAADVLLTGDEPLTQGRLGCVGHSGGAMMAGAVSGLDHRFACFVFEAGLSGMSYHYRDSQHPMIKAQRETMTPEQYEPLLDLMRPYDAVNFIGDATVPLLFQSARFDVGVSEAESVAFFEAAPEPKRLRWYDSGHVINDPAAYADRALFLGIHLGLPALPRLLAERASGS